MTARRIPIERMPSWPRLMRIEIAAAYVGAGPQLFLQEVAEGKWPLPTKRGTKGGLATWDREALDRAIDAASLTPNGSEPDSPPISDSEFREILRGAAKKGRAAARHSAA